MSVLRYYTLGNENPKGLRKVYFCSLEADYQRYFQEISTEILNIQRCSIWYAPKDAVKDQAFYRDLLEMDLFVLPVTTELVTLDNSQVKKEIEYAQRNGIPVLPLIREQGENLLELFNANFGQLQSLDPYNPDVTALPYAEKLRTYLQTVLIGDEQAEKIRQAFDAYLFLSYRKMDRSHAQHLMKLIHKNDFCRDVAIWYDEFLTPGENFNDTIAHALKNSDLFVLTITPNILKPSSQDETGTPVKNYVVRVEFKEAYKQNKDMILPVQMVPTNETQLNDIFDNQLPLCTDGQDLDALSNSLKKKLGHLPLRQKDGDPEHGYLMGLAYLSGVDVEKDSQRASLLLCDASREGYCKATEKLAQMHYVGIGINRDLKQAIYWQKQLMTQLEKIMMETKDASSFHRWFWCAVTYADYLVENNDYSEAEHHLHNLLALCRTNYQDLGFGYQDIVLERLGDVKRLDQQTPDAMKYYDQCQKIRQAMISETDDPNLVRRLALSYERMGNICSRLEDHDAAIRYYQLKLQQDKRLIEIRGSLEDQLDLFHAYYQLGNNYMKRCMKPGSDKVADIRNAAIYGDLAVTAGESLSKGNLEAVWSLRLSSAYCLMAQIVSEVHDLDAVVIDDVTEGLPSMKTPEEYISRGLQIAQEQYQKENGRMETAQFLLSAYRRLATVISIKTSFLSTLDHSNISKIDVKDQAILQKDLQILKEAKAQYSKAHKLAMTVYRCNGDLTSASDLHQCHLDMARVCRSMMNCTLNQRDYQSLQKKAIAYCEDAIKLAKQHGAARGRADFMEKEAASRIYLTAIDPTKRHRELPEAIKIYKELMAAYPNVEKYRNNADGAQAMLDGTGIINFQ